MGKTKKQKERERIADMCDEIAGCKSVSGNQLRQRNRRIEKRKRDQFKKAI